ncbi:lipase family protein [Stigmatella erecta]|uniref:Lipase (Class 3) n=1 Tax=Stigmatella erecta TaxID=83460 RepID=A0A1I0DYD3_9BACT|nr:hypothetical protein [Stigmatella erecta]SET37286.1 Lipase (class 3) [Stigmatella erecta]
MLNDWQTSFCISNTVNALFGYVAPAMGAPEISQLLAALIDKTLNDPDNITQIGAWTRAWGPCVWQNTGSNTADNSMFVAVNADKTQYIAAVAATGLHSTFDQQTEDIQVAHVTWPSFSPAHGDSTFIAKGTSIGLTNLLNMVSNGQSLAQFLSTVANKNATLILTGHSLGGALVMPLSLYLFTQSGLSQSSWANVYVYPTAAPTPGSAAFNGLFSATFPPNPAKGTGTNVWNQVIWNFIDVVPHAWTLKADTHGTSIPYLGQITSIYGNPDISSVDNAVTLAAAKVAAANRSAPGYVFNQNNSVFNEGGAPTFPVTDWDTFMRQALYQHTAQYGLSLGTANFNVAQPGLMRASPEQMAAALPLLSQAT